MARRTWHYLAEGCVLTCVVLSMGTVSGAGAKSQAAPAVTGRYSEPYADLLAKPYAYHGPEGTCSLPTGTKEIPIGFFGPPSDAGMRRGAELAIAEANDKGGCCDGRAFRLVARSSVNTWGSAREVVKLAYEDEVLAVMGSLGGQSTHVAEQITTKARLVLISPGSSDVSLTRVNIPWMFRCMPDDDHMAAVLAEHVFNESGYTNVAGIADGTYESRLRMAAFEKKARRMGHPPALSLRCEAGQTDVTKMLQLVSRSGVEAPVLFAGHEVGAGIIREMRDQSMKQAVFAGAQLASPQFAELAGNISDGITLVAPCNLWRDDPLVESFHRRFEERYGERGGFVSAYAYDGMHMLLRAVREGGLNRARVRDALAGIRVFHGVTGEIRFDGSGSNLSPPILLVIRDGRLTPLADPGSQESPPGNQDKQ